MHITKLALRNFKNFRNSTFSFTEGVNSILGENGSGKTNVFHALRLVLDSSLPRKIQLYENDFSRKLPDWRGHWILISLKLENLSADETSQMLRCAETDNSNTGRYTLCFRPNMSIRKKLFDFTNSGTGDKEELEEIRNSITINDYEHVFLGRGKEWFLSEKEYSEVVGDFNKLNFPNPEEDDSSVLGNPIKGQTLQDFVSCTFIKALRDVESDLKSYRNNPLLNLLRQESKLITLEEKKKIVDGVQDLNINISNVEQVKKLGENIASSLIKADGETYSPNLEVKSDLPDDIEQLFRSLNLWVGDPDEEGYLGRIWQLSLGGSNLIYLSLKLLEYEVIHQKHKSANFILIEEPEAHIHTHIQRTLFQNLSKHKTQVILSSHSTHISSVSKVESVNVLSRKGNESLVFSPTKNLDSKQIVHLQRYLDAVRSDLLFAKSVILVEGDAEQILIPKMFKDIYGLSLDELGISLINIGSVGFENIADVFHSERIRKRCAIITDLDTPLQKLPEDSNTDTEFQKSARKAFELGQSRKKKFTEKFVHNKFIGCFYADTTFETDILLRENLGGIHECCIGIYKNKSSIQKINKTFGSSKDIGKKKMVLKIAKLKGKGWFALELAEECNKSWRLPTYIVESIRFVMGELTKSKKMSIIKYRAMEKLEAEKKDDESYYDNINNTDEETLRNYLRSKQDPQLNDLLGNTI